MLTRRRRTSPVMVGRRGELDELRGLLDQAAATGVPATALVIGQAGVGKSRLLDELLEATGCPMALVGHGRDEDEAAPFGVVRDAVAGHVADWDGAPHGLDTFAHPLAHLLTPWLRLEGHPDDGHEHTADELALVAVALVRQLVDGGPALVAFEDAHWADAESLLVLRRLARAHQLPALVVATLRPEDFDRRHLLGRLLSDLDRRRATHVALEPLTRPELRELLGKLTGRPVTDAVADLLHERTQGNPFFVEELIAAASRDGTEHAPALGAVDAPLPWTATEAAARRVDELAGEARHVLHVAAVLGQRFSFAVLQAVAGLDREAVAGALSVLVARGVLVEHAPDEFAFRHALTREAVTGRLLSRQRQAIHAKALEALLTEPAPDPRLLTVHAHGAGDRRATRQYARESAEQALRTGAPRSAARVARLGLAGGEDLTLQSVLTRASAQVGEMQDAAAHAKRWADAAAAQGDAAEEAAAQRLLAWAQWSRGDRAGAWRAVAAAERAAEASGALVDMGWAAAVRAQLLGLAGRPREAVAQADRALTVAAHIDDRRLRAHAMVTKGTAVLDVHADEEPGRVDEAVALLDLARAEAEEIGDVHTLTRALNNRVFPNPGATSVAESRTLLEDARRAVGRYGAERFGAKLAAIEAYLAILDGDSDAARAALAGAQPADVPMDEYFWVALAAFVEAETGDLGRARRLIDEHRPGLDRLEAEAHVDFALAEAAAAAACRDATLGHEALARVGAAINEVPAGSAVTWWDVAVCALQSGVAPDAVRAARASWGPAEGLRGAAGSAHLAGMLAAGRGDRDDAVAALRRACQRPSATRPAALLADAESRLAELLAQAGDLPTARRHAAAAAEALAGWPGWRRDAVEALQRRLGDAARPPHDLLTPREREVCVLLASGLSNGEIAKELFISAKTAAVHVSNILAKTGLQRRAQVAAWAVQAGLTEPDR